MSFIIQLVMLLPIVIILLVYVDDHSFDTLYRLKNDEMLAADDIVLSRFNHRIQRNMKKRITFKYLNKSKSSQKALKYLWHYLF